LDFGAILAATNGAKPSVVQFRAGDLSPDTIGRHLIDALRRMEAELQRGALLTIELDALECGFCRCGIDRAGI
jgi:predicted nuclease of predicted toxin-antitoxin system